MMLDPLTEIRIRVLVAIGIGRRKFVMHVLSHRKGSDRQQDDDQPGTDTESSHVMESSKYGTRAHHRTVATIEKIDLSNHSRMASAHQELPRQIIMMHIM